MMERIFVGNCGSKNVKKGFEVGGGSENVIFFILVLQQSQKLS